MASRLSAIEHIVVLMMENRSFDHMLGYLSLKDMSEVRGLTGSERNLDEDGNTYPVFEFPEDQTAFHKPGQPLDKSLDPCHGSGCVRDQIAGGTMAGFVSNFIQAKSPPHDQRGLPMGYFSDKHLPVYDHLAHNFCVCDAWHSSVPADTWPNRLYALSGRSEGSVAAETPVLKSLLRLGERVTRLPWVREWPFVKRVLLPKLAKLRGLPIYDVESFARHLKSDEWRWYSHDPSTLRAADGAYRRFRFPDPQLGNFAYFNRKKVALRTELAETPFVVGDSFLDDAAKGELRRVSWIDPNFVDLSIFDPNSDDDHPPSDVRAGQALVLDVYEALLKSPQWENTLLVITYDEHGGFHDHVPPPAVSDESGFPTLGVRVPALVVGPRVKRHVCHEQFEHTTLPKTILQRFAPDPARAIAAMGPRVRDAPDLETVLDDAPDTSRTGPQDVEDLREALNPWLRRNRAARRAAPEEPSPAPDGAGHDIELNEFQHDYLAASLVLRRAGLPAGHP